MSRQRCDTPLPNCEVRCNRWAGHQGGCYFAFDESMLEDVITTPFNTFVGELFGDMRWMLCCATYPELNSSAPDCACVISGDVSLSCGCICHRRINEIERFLISTRRE